MEQKQIEVLKTIPSPPSLLVKVAFSFLSRKRISELIDGLPSFEYQVSDVLVNNEDCLKFNSVTKWVDSKEYIHPCFIHTLAFPLHISLMSLPNFPFPLLGLVHLENRITQFRPVRVNEKLDLKCKFGDLKEHPKGWVFSIKVLVYSRCKLVWESTSVYLFKNKKTSNKEDDKGFSQAHLGKLNWGCIELNSNLGRLYAKCSGDFNPIHLAKWLAKGFGFHKHIAHGMWTKSWCLSMINSADPKALSQAFSVKVEFKKPIYLPNRVDLFLLNTDSKQSVGTSFNVESVGSKVHLIGKIQSLHTQ
ncbi:MaoC family dehydratase [Paraglaciecola sp. 2405UD69-4]|uniref:MaoC family dehydratase n=1 Tax=Paraglaciecola sp. 2405UD69-4 TaxID=3391836 RepID=UPI0039C9E313